MTAEDLSTAQPTSPLMQISCRLMSGAEIVSRFQEEEQRAKSWFDLIMLLDGGAGGRKMKEDEFKYFLSLRIPRIFLQIWWA